MFIYSVLFFLFCLFSVSLVAGKRTYTLKDPAGNVTTRVFKIIGVRNFEFAQSQACSRRSDCRERQKLSRELAPGIQEETGEMSSLSRVFVCF